MSNPEKIEKEALSADMDFQQRLKAIIKVLNLSQRDFATRIGISGPAVTEILQGKYKPNYDFLVKLVTEFKINIYYLMFGEGEMFMGNKPFIADAKYSLSAEQLNKFFYYFERSPHVQMTLMIGLNKCLQTDDLFIKQEVADYEKKFK